MALPEIVLPAWAGKIGGKLPGRPPRFALVFALNTMLKRGLLPADMSLFDGKKFEIDVLDAGIKVRFTANAEKFIDADFFGTPDLRLAANDIDFMRMMIREENTPPAPPPSSAPSAKTATSTPRKRLPR